MLTTLFLYIISKIFVKFKFKLYKFYNNYKAYKIQQQPYYVILFVKYLINLNLNLVNFRFFIIFIKYINNLNLIYYQHNIL